MYIWLIIWMMVSDIRLDLDEVLKLGQNWKFLILFKTIKKRKVIFA